MLVTIYKSLQVFCLLSVCTAILVFLFPVRHISSFRAIIDNIKVLFALSLGHLVSTRIFIRSSTINRTLSTADLLLKLQEKKDRILIMNHQLYTDWVYLGIFCHAFGFLEKVTVILKKSIRKAPLLGFAMNTFGFVYLSRKWAVDADGLTRAFLSLPQNFLLLIFPEGTTYHPDTIAKSSKYAQAQNRAPLKRVLLPRSTGLHHAFETLHCDIVDCTLIVDGAVSGRDTESLYPIHKVLFGNASDAPAKVVIDVDIVDASSVPNESKGDFDEWLYQRFVRKDAIIERELGSIAHAEDDKDMHELAISSWWRLFFFLNTVMMLAIFASMTLKMWIAAIGIYATSYALGFMVVQPGSRNREKRK